ncbi:AraC family transcriptional regulator [Rhodobacter sp. 24-YEA-8]|uniref:AraC family transcriptional regulator n=1 Tax=Rhodobacter sp. 24-YEA-8 TaxID=1884310 RepID=UPI000B85AEBC|nr:AraC family transcriptional regulator [Rhodobacter sp. 24-YEA-8]
MHTLPPPPLPPLSPPPLWKRSSSLEEFEAVMSDLLRPCRVRGKARRGYRTEILHQRVNGLGLTAVRLGAPASVRVAPDRAISLLQIPVGGTFLARSGRRGEESFRSGLEAQVVDAPTALDLDFSQDSRMLIVDLSAPQITALACGPLPSGSLSLATPEGAQLWRLAQYLLTELESGVLVGDSPLALGLEQSLIGAIARALKAHMPAGGRRGAAWGAAAEAALPPQPGAVAVQSPNTSSQSDRMLLRAEAFMASHLDQVIDPAAIAQAVGTSVRSLHRLMRDKRGTTPLAALKEMRLQRVRAEIEAGLCPPNGITDLALRFGFNHLGAFATDFRRRFGAPPSELSRRHAQR